MNPIKHSKNTIFFARGMIITLILLFSAITIAQESLPEEFIFGATSFRSDKHIPDFYDKFTESGMNFLSQYADDSSRGLLQGLDFEAVNGERLDEWIFYYSTAYYSKWEAEEDQINRYKVGFKHRERVEGEEILGDLIGSSATFLGRQCWSTVGLTLARDSLIYGPHYHQEKVYKRWPDENLYPGYDRYDLRYTPRFIMALTNPNSVPDTQVVCRLRVIARYREANPNPYGNDSDMVLKERILKVSDFAPYDTFKVFYFGNLPAERWYIYPSEFRDPQDGSNKRENLPSEGIQYFDRWGDQGVQFCIDWLRNDTNCNLYIDYIDVYDNEGGQDFPDYPDTVKARVANYALDFPQSLWPNMKYWAGCDEPSSLDDYIPMKTVDSILDLIDAPRLLTTFYPWWEGTVNGDNQLERYYNTVHPKKLMIDFFPFVDFRNPAGYDDWETTRKMFQTCSSLDPDFYYQAAAFGYKVGGHWKNWRRPNTREYKAQIMLALAHGVKGILNYTFNSLHSITPPYYDGTYGIIELDYTPTDLYDVIKDTLVPRLNGKLGKTLLDLDYTGDYVELRRWVGPNTSESETRNYLTLSTTNQNPIPFTYYFHAGFFERPNQGDNHHFLLTNLITTNDRWVNVKVANDCSNYSNNRFRNIESELNFDTTFTCNFSIDILFPPGEGYLFQVAPVVIYGGKLIYPETISNTTTLIDEMVIQNGATLTVNSTYNVDRNIRIKAGGQIITTTGGTLKFYEGSKLIIEGAATIAGTASHNLILDFVSPENSNGIVIKSGGSLNISYCEVKNAVKGINWELNAVYLNAQHVDFTDCDSVSINILGREMGDGPTPPVPLIKDCTIINSMDGISVANLSEITIQLNSITNTDLGIYLSSVTNAHVITNQINSNTEALEGILLLSSGGDIWGNTVTGHTVGIHLGNSSPKIGVNTITANKYHGIYIGTGSFPYMNGEYVGTPPKGYTLSGYNKIKENGGWEEVGGPSHNDGSEIYFFSSNAVLAYGCNSIYDDREPSPPLINTLLLMNGYRFGFPTIQAQYNFWGDTVYAARFGNLNVTYEPYWLNSCDSEGGGEDELIVRTSYGEAIDTLYSTGTEVPELTMTELAYAEADGYFLTGNLTDALQIYEGIITGNATNEEKYLAYERKYEIGRLTGQSNEFFNAMGNTFNTLATNAEDSIRVKIFMQLATLCKVGEEEYVPAITEFDEIVQQNPNTEEAVYAEIDALTTALLVEDEDSSLHKGRLGKYLVKTSGDYNRRVDDILRKNFGSDAKESEKDLLPTEYTLYQNFPNPFNPITTIKYDLPNAGEVSLIIYDILGRRVKQLVNDKQQPGRYEIKFDASNLASGVYIYQLITDKYINAKKMILLK